MMLTVLTQIQSFGSPEAPHYPRTDSALRGLGWIDETGATHDAAEHLKPE
jgi:hypothetical protein